MIAKEIQTQSYDENTFFVYVRKKYRNTLRYYYDRMVPRKATGLGSKTLLIYFLQNCKLAFFFLISNFKWRGRRFYDINKHKIAKS